MMRTSRRTIARRCAACLMLGTAAVCSIAAILDGRPDNLAPPLPANQYESVQHYQFNQLPVGHIAEVFSRAR